MSDNRLYLECSCGRNIKIVSVYMGAELGKLCSVEDMQKFIDEHKPHGDLWWESEFEGKFES